MAGTTLQDVIVPELFNPYVINRTMELSALAQSGIIVNNTEFDALASQASPMVNMPFFEDLTGESEQVIEGTDLNDNKITSNKDVAVIIRRAKMWSATDLSAALAGTDPMMAIASLVARFWERDMQKELIAILKGVFGTVSAGSSGDPAAETRLETNILDISGLSGTKANWSGSAFIDAEQKLGDAKAQLTGVCMHSATEAYLKKQNLIETVQPSNDVAFGLYQGKRVIVDDGCPVADGVYTTYLFGNGAVALGNGNPAGFVLTETDREKRKGSGVDYLINRKTMILHPRGIAWQNAEVAKTEGPSRTEVAIPKNWKPVYEPKADPYRGIQTQAGIGEAMTKSEMLIAVKNNLKDDTRDLDISDVILSICDYCNLDPDCLPELLEPVIRKKVKGIIDYEAVKGTGYQQDISAIKEGEGSITYATGGSNARDGIYGLSDADKSSLRQFRRLRGYD